MIEIALFAVVLVSFALVARADYCATKLIRARIESAYDAYERGFEDGSRGARALDCSAYHEGYADATSGELPRK